MSENLVIKKMSSADIDILHKIEYEVYGEDGQSKESMFQDICEEDSYFFGAYYKNEIVGFASFGKEDEGAGTRIDIWNIAVKDMHRRKGYGRMLLKKINEEALSLDAGCIEAPTSNKNAIELYESEGFCLDRQVENFYHTGECAHVMRKELCTSNK